MAKKVHGICCICGQETELTFEHIPPRAAFNHFSLKLYDFGDTFLVIVLDIISFKRGLVCTHCANAATILQENGTELLMLNLLFKECAIISTKRKGY